VSHKASQNPAQHVPARPCASLHGKKGDVGKNSAIVAGASTYNNMCVGADAPNNRAGGIRILLSVLQTSTRDTSYKPGQKQAAQYPAHVQAFLVDQRLKLVQETWNQLPEVIKADITAMVQACWYVVLRRC
jgi:hypothetical protein